MNINLLVSYYNHKGGVNNLKVVSVCSGFITIKSFSGKTAEKRAKAFAKKIIGINHWIA
jgi:hypothetical protein